MAKEKRKASAASQKLAKSSQTSHDAERATKRRRKEVVAGDSADQAPSTENQPRPSLLQKSLVTQEERAFPRGGASVLTPLERKQIHAQAARDVLFEEAGNKRARPQADSDEELFDDQKTVVRGKPADSGSQKRKKPKKNASLEAAEETVKIENVRYKNMEPGMLLLGRISRVSADELLVDLPNNLSGSVSILNISKQLTAKLDEMANADIDDAEEDSSNVTQEVDLKSLYYVGQYIRVSVVSTESSAGSSDSTKARRKIELSIYPEVANAPLLKTAVTANTTLQATVVSVEDHGWVMDVGLDDGNVRAFLSSKDIGHDPKESTTVPGRSILCVVTQVKNNGNILSLSTSFAKEGKAQKVKALPDLASVDTIQPGATVNMLITHVNDTTLVGKVMGMIPATADVIHSGAASTATDLDEQVEVGTTIKARVIANFPHLTEKTVAVSLLDPIMAFGATPALLHPVGSFVDDCKILRVEPGLGVFVDLGATGAYGFVHLSRLSGENVDASSLSTGKFCIGKTHRGRVLGFNSIDGLYSVAFAKSVLEQQYLRIDDVPVGDIIDVTIEKLVIDSRGKSGLAVQIAQGVSGYVREMHLADVKLQHPERKFKPGVHLKARVLSVDALRRQVILTLKKSLINTELPVWTAYDDISVGDHSIGTIIGMSHAGAVVAFYGDIRAFLPASQMSETYIKNPIEHFQIGQAVTVHAISVNPAEAKMTVSCRVISETNKAIDAAFQKLKPGDIVSGYITEKSQEDITLELEDSGVRASLRSGQLSDHSRSKNQSLFKSLRVGQKLKELVVLELFEKRRSVVLSGKSSFIKAARAGSLVTNCEDVKVGTTIDGYVSNVTENGVFMRFGGGVTGYLSKTHLTDELRILPGFGLDPDKSFSARVTQKDVEKKQLSLSLRKDENSAAVLSPSQSKNEAGAESVKSPVDGLSNSFSDYHLGKVTKARISSIKETQLNVQLAENVQGRIDISEAFQSWDDIKDRKYPFKAFRIKQVLDVKIIGMHNSRNHRFLPISHRSSKQSVFELTTNLGSDGSNAEVLTIDKIRIGEVYTAFVNNISDVCLWVNLSPQCRGRVERQEVSNDVSIVNDLESNYPIGSAMRVRALKIDVDNGRLDLTARNMAHSSVASLEDLSVGTIISGRVTKTIPTSVILQINPSTVGSISLTELVDDYDDADPLAYAKNEVVKAAILGKDEQTNRIVLSSRPSKVLSSTLPVRDRSIIRLSQLKVNDAVRGFIKNIADVGLFVTIGHDITGFVRVSELSDAFVKDWKKNYSINQLIKAKIISIDESTQRVQMSLKASVLDKNYKPLLTFHDIEVGQIVVCKVRKVEDFGVFLVVENSHNVSGLCHRSEIAEERVSDVRKLYSEGEIVKARVLKLEPNQRKLAFGLKASYIPDSSDSDNDSDIEESIFDDARNESDDGGVILGSGEAESSSSDEELIDPALDLSADDQTTGDGLDAGGFDWNGIGRSLNSKDALDEPKIATETQKKRRKPEIQVDRTGDLDKYGPQTADDFERLLLSQRNNSKLWIEYMAFYMQLGELAQAREIAERALREIHILEQDEKLNVWVAYLTLENTFGDNESLEAVFKRARESCDLQEIYTKMANIYIGDGKFDQADELFQTMVKTKAITPDPKFWFNYATFLFDTLAAPERGRELLKRAMQSVPNHLHRDLITQFAQLEFKRKNGDPERGRTAFEGLLDTYPKRHDIWDIFVEMEKHQKAWDNTRHLYERMSQLSMKTRRAKFVFKQWRDFEEQHGTRKDVEQVEARAAAYVKSRASDA